MPNIASPSTHWPHPWQFRAIKNPKTTPRQHKAELPSQGETTGTAAPQPRSQTRATRRPAVNPKRVARPCPLPPRMGAHESPNLPWGAGPPHRGGSGEPWPPSSPPAARLGAGRGAAPPGLPVGPARHGTARRGAARREAGGRLPSAQRRRVAAARRAAPHLTFAGGDVAEADLGGFIPVLVGALGPVPRSAVGFGPRVLRHRRPPPMDADGTRGNGRPAGNLPEGTAAPPPPPAGRARALPAGARRGVTRGEGCPPRACAPLYRRTARTP